MTKFEDLAARLAGIFCIALFSLVQGGFASPVELTLEQARAIKGGTINYICSDKPEETINCGDASYDPCTIALAPDQCYIAYFPLGVWKCNNNDDIVRCRLYQNARKTCVFQAGKCCVHGLPDDPIPCGNISVYYCKPNPHHGNPNCKQCAVSNRSFNCAGNCL